MGIREKICALGAIGISVSGRAGAQRASLCSFADTAENKVREDKVSKADVMGVL